MLRYAFRLHRWGMVGYGFVLFLTPLVQASAFSKAAGTTPESRALFARDMSALAAQLAYLLPVPHHLDTLAGYLLWRAWGTLPILVAVWAVAAAAGAVRGDEDRQLVDTWLAARVPRARLVAARLLAFAAAALVPALAAGVSTVLGAGKADPVGLDRVAGQVLALWLVTVAFFAVSFLVAQLPASTRGAQAAGAALVLLLYLINATARSRHSLDSVAWVSPFKWYEATDVLAAGGGLSVAGVTLSISVTLAAAVLAAIVFNRRDLRGPLFAGPARETRVRDVPASPALLWPVVRLLYRQRWLLVGWALFVGVMAVFMVATARSVVDNFLNLPTMRSFLTHGAGGDPYRAYIATFWFGIAQFLFAGFAIHLVSAWAADDTDGVLEAVLSRPTPRWSVIMERAVSALLGIAILTVVGSVTAALAAAASGTSLDAAGVFRAGWLLVPFALAFAAAGAAGAARWPRAAVGVLGVLAFLSYMGADIGPLLGWPGWVADLSVFQLYGMPLTAGIFWTGLWAMVGIVVAGFGLAMLLMQRREVAGR